MTARRKYASWRTLTQLLVAFALIAAACGSDSGDTDEVLRIGAIPDQEPERLQRTYGLLADYLAEELDVEVEYVPVTD